MAPINSVTPSSHRSQSDQSNTNDVNNDTTEARTDEKAQNVLNGQTYRGGFFNPLNWGWGILGPKEPKDSDDMDDGAESNLDTDTEEEQSENLDWSETVAINSRESLAEEIPFLNSQETELDPFDTISSLNNENSEQISAAKSTAEKANEITATRIWNAITTVSSALQTIGSSVKAGTFAALKKGGEMYVSSYAKNLDKEVLVAVAYERIHASGVGSEYIAFSQFVTKILYEPITNLIPSTIDIDKQLIKDLLDINLAIAFSNLAVNVQKEGKSIKNFGNQPVLVSIISLFAQKISEPVAEVKMAQVEEKYREHRQKHAKLIKEIFPNIDDDSEKKALLNQWANGQLSGSLSDTSLFPEFQGLSEEVLEGYIMQGADDSTRIGSRWNQARILAFSMEKEIERRQELKAIFKPAVDDLIKYCFPNKVKDLVIPKLNLSTIGMGSLQEKLEGFIYNSLMDVLTNQLVEAYNPLEKDLTLRQGRERVIQDRIGDVNIEGLIDAPAALILNLGKKFIQTDPKVISLVEDILNTPSLAVQPQTTSAILAKCSQEQLAGWIVESVQIMLHTNDPNLLKVGYFTQGVLRNLTLSLLAQGAELVIPEGQTIDEGQFIKELIDRILAKIKTIEGGKVISDEFLKDFARKLPLPELLIEKLLIPRLIEKAKSLQNVLTEMSPDFQQVQSLYNDAVQKVNEYQEGEQLLEISQAFSHQIVDTALSRHLDLIDSIGLGSELEELFNNYLPGLKIDETLKQWFKRNITALTANSIGEPESVSLIKKGIQAAILKAMVNTIQINFHEDSSDYAAQLFSNIHQAFQKAFPVLNAEKIEEMKTALALQGTITKNDQEIKRLQKIIANPFSGITPEQTLLIQAVIQGNKQLLRASHEVILLENRLNHIFEKLNKNSSIDWSRLQLNKARAAIAYRQTIQDQFQIEKESQSLMSDLAVIRSLKLKLDDKLASSAALIDLQKLQEERLHLDMLITLFSLSTEELSLVSEAMVMEKTLQNANKEHDYLLKVLQEKEKAVQNEKPSINQAQWDQALIQKGFIIDAFHQIQEYKKENLRLTVELDKHLGMFQVLVNELSGLIGLGQKEKLELPVAIQDQIWPYIESVKEKQLGRLVFAQLSPIILTIVEAKSNQQMLASMGTGSQLLAQLSHVAASSLIDHLPKMVASYKPFAQSILKLGNIIDPSEGQIVAMEQALTDEMQKQGLSALNLGQIKHFLEKRIPQEDIDRVSERLLVLKESRQILSEEHIRTILAENQELYELNLDKKSKELVLELHHMSIQLGKEHLTTELLVSAFERALNQTLDEQEQEFLKASLENQKILGHIKKILLTPERLAELLNDAIPGASSLHTLMAPQIQEMLSGTGTVFQGNWSILERYIEGTLLKVFVKIAETNEGENSLAVIGEKLNNFIQDPTLIQGRSKEEAASLVTEKILKNILGVQSEQDIIGIPAVLQKMAYQILKEQAYEHLSPVLLPMIEKEQNKEILKHASGSKLLGNLARAFSKDVFKVFPSVFRSLRPTANLIFKDLAGREPTSAELDEFTHKIAELTEHAREQMITNKAVVDAYLQTAHLHIENEVEFTNLIQIIDQKSYRDQLFILLEELFDVLITPEQVTNSLQKGLPQMNGIIAQQLANQLESTTHLDNPAYQNLSGFASNYVESMFLRLFVKIAQKNPPSRGKDSLIVLTEKLLAVVERKYQEAKTRQIEVVAQELNDEVFKEILGLDSEEAFEGIPEPLRKVVYDAVKDQLNQLVLQIHHHVSETADQQNQTILHTKESLKKYGVEAQTGKAYVDIIVEDISQEVMRAILSIINEAGPNGNRLINKATTGINSYLEDLSKANFEVAKILLNYAKAPAFQQMVGEKIEKVSASDVLIEDKQKVAALVGNLVLGNLHQLFERVIHFEEQQGAQFNRNLMSNLFSVVGKHIELYNKAKKIAKVAGRNHISHEDFVKAADSELHSAIPTKPISYDLSVAEINKRLNERLTIEQQNLLKIELANMVALQEKGDEAISINKLVGVIEKIRGVPQGAQPLSKSRKHALNKVIDGKSIKDFIKSDANIIKAQRQTHFHDPATKTLMKMLFPNGKKDLDFIPENLRLTIWKLLKTDVFPIAIQSFVETVLDEANVKKIISSALAITQETLNKEIVLDTTPPEDPSLEQLNDASAELIAAVLEMIELPAVVKNKLRNSKTGKINPSLKRAVGASLGKQFNENFIEKILKSALKSAAERDSLTREPTISIDPSSETAKKIKREQKIAELDVKIKQQTYDVVDASVSYAIKNLWKTAQAKFDALIFKAFGKMGLNLKNALDILFNFIFFKIIGSVLEFIYDKTGLKKLMKKILYNFLSLDANRERILDFLTCTPDNQPVDSHPLHLEALVYNLAKEIQLTVEKALREDAFSFPVEENSVS
ncbi:hypothetical protein [Candidatus Protochlamydia amoebophila]|uniref:Uncharacterized protein n=1 Tax=Protochlamydia amoebophila (strain UWE25) TaxID=264201 RepID=Q6MAB1_PARUW|nr:hypothetical protein [Candidatus Protochlamydia amoebophila]CAF24488.1 unnamed protein product [Candidatus Protochlamydia amoebophila UWE25]